MQKYETLQHRMSPSGVLNNGTPITRKRRRKNVPKIVATFVSASRQGQRMHSARTKIWTFAPKPEIISHPLMISRSNSTKPSPTPSVILGSRSPNPSSGILARQDLADAFKASIYNSCSYNRGNR
jgi:hypothetical protein